MIEEFINFFNAHGLVLTIIAIVGIIGLGILKYAGAFSKYDEKTRHSLYFIISVGFSLVASAVYLLIIKQFDFKYLLVINSAIYGLNQVCYSIFTVTSLDELMEIILDAIMKLVAKINAKTAEAREKRKENKSSK